MVKILSNKVWEFIGKIHTQWIPTGPLYKVYMGLIIKGTIPRVPPFSLWGILDVSLGGEKPETCSVLMGSQPIVATDTISTYAAAHVDECLLDI